MKRKIYEKPTAEVVKLRHTGMLMASELQGGGKGSIQDYTVNTFDEE